MRPGSVFAPVGELLVVDDGQRVICHLCGAALQLLSTSHLRRHGWTAAQYRETFGLSRSTALCSPAITEQRRQLGLVRYRSNQRLRDGLAVGQQMARSGELLAMAHAAQPAGSARAQTRGRLSAAASRRDTAAQVAQRVEARLQELGFGGSATPVLASSEPAGAGDLDRQTSRFVRIVTAHSAELAMPDLRAISRVLEHGCADAARVLRDAGDRTPGADRLARTLAAVIPAALELREVPGRSTANPHLALHAAAADLQARMGAMAQQAHHQPTGACDAERRRLSAAALEFTRHVPVLAQAVEVAIRESIHAGVLLVPNHATEGTTSLAWVTGRMAPGQGVPALQQAAREFSKLATELGPAVQTTQLSLDKHRAAGPDGRSKAVASAVSHAGAARAQLREALGYRLTNQPAALASPLPAHPRLAPGRPASTTTR